MGDEIGLSAGRADRWADDLARGHIELIMNDSVPWRMYSNSRRSTLPGPQRQAGAARSSAWTPVISSVLTMRSPAAARAGASRYVVHTSASRSFPLKGLTSLTRSENPLGE